MYGRGTRIAGYTTPVGQAPLRVQVVATLPAGNKKPGRRCFCGLLVYFQVPIYIFVGLGTETDE